MNSVLQFIQNGGVMMYPLIICSIVLIALIIERLWTFRRLSVDGDELLDEIRAVRPEGTDVDNTKALEICGRVNRPLARIFARGLKNAHRSDDAIEMAMEQEAANETPAFEANLSIIKTIINIAPLLGLLGTIAGMISSFRAASQQGLSNPTAVLGGISEALISTATGITIAVIGFIFFNYFSLQARKMVEDIEFYGAALVNHLTGRVD